MRKFATGATRNDDTHKLSYRGFLSFRVLRKFAEYMHGKRIQADGVYRDPDNWKKGIDVQVYQESLNRHLFDLNRIFEGEVVHDDDTGEELDKETLLCAIMFNTQGMLFELLKKTDDTKS